MTMLPVAQFRYDITQVPSEICGVPALMVGVLLDEAGAVSEIRAGNQLPVDYHAEGWLEYALRSAFEGRPGPPHIYGHESQ